MITLTAIGTKVAETYKIHMYACACLVESAAVYSSIICPLLTVLRSYISFTMNGCKNEANNIQWPYLC